MVSIARRNLFAEKSRLLITVGGVAFAVLLMGILVGLYQGWNDIVTTYIRSTDADLWVRQEGSADMFHSVSFLPGSVGERLRPIEGINQVSPFVGRVVKLHIKGEETTTYLVGYDPEEGIGGPVRTVSGAASPGRGQIIIDRALADSRDIKIGQRLHILDKDLEVVGISEGGNMMLYAFSFITRQDATELLGMENQANYYLVKLSPGFSKAAAIDRISQQFPGVKVLSSEDFIEVNRQFIDETFLPIIAVLVMIGFGVGVAVIGLTIYTATMDKSREYGVLKALGASNGRLYRIVLEQALISGVLGYALGAVLVVLVAGLAQRATPMFVTSVNPPILLGLLALALFMSLVASYFPVNRLVRIDPAIVFRS